MMSKTPLISVIIPIHNCQNYIKECLESLRLQTYKNLEFICINDGSTDGSQALLKSFQAKDERFIILNQARLGQSIAKNKGFQQSKGKYISFIDADDRVSLSLYQKFIKTAAKENFDIYIFNANEYNKESASTFPRQFFTINDWMNHDNENTIHTFADIKNPFVGNMGVCNKIFKKEFLNKIAENGNELFTPNCIFEDIYFHFLCLTNNPSILVNLEPLYYYREPRQDSMTKTLSRNVFDIFKITEKLTTHLIKTNYYEKYKYAYFQYLFKEFTGLLIKCPPNLRPSFFNNMRIILSAHERRTLNPDITRNLVGIEIYNDLKKMSGIAFFDKYKDKIKL